ncbi:uncharacterized protein GGS22DRAFT_186960 [Annulohypoxylon maeteangense]|uniref:uncharacterized protein n=1 Tax=Annulohypoxylon maeteangense TaxID=1927788 RepID=UPI002007BDB8|nr:uncharacterized protein GGS22DRAFT_186960 [Annulohypoxylon maeteangense]KAI0886883.1 hypothetical protein GGS22DRAFT_186960 [Annulohypoxylon maeteangense]
MSLPRGQATPSPSSGDGQDERSPLALYGLSPIPEYDPGVISFPLRIASHRAWIAPARRWPTAPLTRTTNARQLRGDADIPQHRTLGLNSVAPATTAPSGGNHIPPRAPQADADGVRNSPRKHSPPSDGPAPILWGSGYEARPPVAARQARQHEEGYVPMGRYSNNYTRSILHPSVWDRQLQITGISANYGGNIFLRSNQSANIPEQCSTSLWLTNLPPDCTHQLLLGTIRGCGKIYAAVINPPVYTNEDYTSGTHHSTAASKLVFFDRAGLDKLMAKSQAGEFSVGGYVPRLRMNRIKSTPRAAGPHCRVLHIEGPSSIVNERFLGAFFQSKFKYELELVLTLATHGSRTRQEWRFGSYRCQAESARQAINREKLRSDLDPVDFCAWSQVSVHFGVDPCAQD